MRVCIEEFVLINFCMDFTIILLSARGLWFLSIPRIALASFAVSVYALWDQTAHLPWWMDALSFWLMSVISYPLRDISLFMNGAVVCMFAFLVMGACTSLFMRYMEATLASYAAGLLAGAAFILLAKSALNTTSQVQRVFMKVTYGAFKAEFSAIVDTGNLLKEPISALPVLIADECALGKRLYEAAGAAEKQRLVEYTAVSGIGRLRLVRADKMEILRRGRWKRAPDMWLGVKDGNTLSSVHALAPRVCARGGQLETEGRS